MEIQGYPNYLIYPDGRVWSKGSKYKKQQFLKEYINQDNSYKYVGLVSEGKQKQVAIHRLIAIHYIDNPNNYKEVDHINRDRGDYRIENLKWVNRCENLLNQGVRKNNKIGIKNIHYDKKSNKYRFKKMYRGVVHIRDFDTLEEAIEYKITLS